MEIRELVDRIFQRLDPENRRGVYRVWSFWAEEVGEAIAKRAQPAGYHGGVLSVRVSSHAWMQELQFLKEDIRARLNARLGGDQIRDIYFIAGRSVTAEAPPEPEPPPEPEEAPAVPIPPLRDRRLSEAFERVAQAHARRSRRNGRRNEPRGNAS